MLPAPGANIFEIIATGDRRTDDQQHDLFDRIHHPPRLPVIAKLGKMLQQNGQTCPRGRLVQHRTRQCEHVALDAESERTRIHILRVKTNLPQIAR
jgi:hypothetical protein